MTLILAIPAQDGVVFGSDSQVTSGLVRSTGRKIFKLNERTLWGASGELALIQQVQERLETLTEDSRNQPLADLRVTLANAIKESVESLLRTDFRTPFCKTPEDYLRLHLADFLFVEYRENPRPLHITIDGTPEWIEPGFAVTGNGAIFAQALLGKYSDVNLTCDTAKLLAYKVIEEAIQVGAYGLGPPIDIWEITSNKMHKCEDSEIAALADAARTLREGELHLLMDGGISNSNTS